MKTRVCQLALAAAAILLIGGNAATAQEAITEPYTINPGDVLSITVWREPDLQRQALVRPDGGLSFPLAGDINASGMSIEELQQEITNRLSEYIPEPVVTVATEQILGHRIYVIGQVQRPGEFPASSRLDVVQALAIAGGFTPFAQKNDIKILRRVNGVPRAIDFRYGDIEKGRNLETNQILQPGDAIVVP